MTVNGHVENGMIVLDDSVPLVNGMKVRVELLADDANSRVDEEEPAGAEAPTLYERWKPLFGMIKDAPSDYAENLDHYLYGQPK